MIVTKLPDYVYNSRGQDYTRAKYISKQISSKLFELKKNKNGLDLDYFLSDEEFEGVRKKMLKLNNDILVLADLFQTFLNISQTSDDELLLQVNTLFQTDLNKLPDYIELLSQRNSIASKNTLRKLINPYRNTMTEFIFIMYSHLNSEQSRQDSSDVSDFEKIISELDSNESQN